MGDILWDVLTWVAYCGMFYHRWHIVGCLPMGDKLWDILPWVTYCGVFYHR